MRRILTVLGRELREAAPAVIFFLVVFHMVALTRGVVLAQQGISVADSAAATIGALIVAKVILIVDKLPVARLFASRLLYSILWKTVLFGVVSVLFRIIEELVPRIVHHGGGELAKLVEEVPWPQFWVIQMWLYAALLAYCLAAELVRIVGPGRVRKLLLGARDGVSEP